VTPTGAAGNPVVLSHEACTARPGGNDDVGALGRTNNTSSTTIRASRTATNAAMGQKKRRNHGVFFERSPSSRLVIDMALSFSDGVKSESVSFGGGGGSEGGRAAFSEVIPSPYDSCLWWPRWAGLVSATSGSAMCFEA
jgi:hypothetical protein